jgi:hypothetical protein
VCLARLQVDLGTQVGAWRRASAATANSSASSATQSTCSAAPFRDRVVHHALVSLLEPHFERRFVAHSYACRVGKGTHRALDRAAELSRKRRFSLKGDIAEFFPSIDHEILKG